MKISSRLWYYLVPLMPALLGLLPSCSPKATSGPTMVSDMDSANSMNRARLEDGRGEAHRLSSLTLGAKTTKDSVLRAWGQPLESIGKGAVWVYMLQDEDGEYLYLWFGKDNVQSLQKACVEGDGNLSEPNQLRVAFDVDPRRTRKLSDLNLSHDLVGEEVYRIWGPPDSKGGSGRETDTYRLSDGSELHMGFFGGPRDFLHYCDLYGPNQQGRRILLEEVGGKRGGTSRPGALFGQ